MTSRMRRRVGGSQRSISLVTAPSLVHSEITVLSKLGGMMSEAQLQIYKVHGACIRPVETYAAQS